MAPKQPPLHTVVTFRNSQGEAARGTLLKLEKSTVVFEVYNPYSIVQLSEVVQDLNIRRGDRIIYRGRAIVSNLVNTGLMLIVSVKVLDPWSGLSTLVRESSDAEVRSEVEQFVREWEHLSRLRESFVLSVSLLRSFLGELHRWLSELDVGNPIGPMAAQRSRAFVLRLGQHLMPKMRQLFEIFEQEANAVPDDDLDHHKACAQRDLHPLLLSSPFVHRTFAKPLGYAGDYEMMNMIERDAAEGQTTYAKLVNTLFLQAAIPQSVRNRTAALERMLHTEAERVSAAGRRFRVLNVGCGPAIEIERFLAGEGRNIAASYVLLDFNRETLAFVQKKMCNAGFDESDTIEFEYRHESVHNLLMMRGVGSQTEDKFDLIYCSGLFDYLSDRICGRLLSLFYTRTAPGGVVFVTNMHTSNPERRVMDLLMEWYLIYRDEEDLLKLAPRLGCQSVRRDATGVNVALEIRKLPAGG